MDPADEKYLREALAIWQEKPTEAVTNGETWNHKTPAQVAVLSEISAAIAERDGLVPELRKATERARRAESERSSLMNRLRSANDRAAQTREAFEVLQKPLERRF